MRKSLNLDCPVKRILSMSAEESQRIELVSAIRRSVIVPAGGDGDEEEIDGGGRMDRRDFGVESRKLQCHSLLDVHLPVLVTISSFRDDNDFSPCLCLEARRRYTNLAYDQLFWLSICVRRRTMQHGAQFKAAWSTMRMRYSLRLSH